MGLETPTVGLQVQPLGAARSTFDGQSAVEAMIAAFRNGQVTTADLIERATKMPALRQAVTDATDPEQVAARKKILVENASQEAITTEANKFALKQAQDLAKIPVQVRAKIEDLAKHGALDPSFSAASYDENQKKVIDARWNSLQKWKRQAELATATLKTVEEKEDYDEAHNPLGKRPVIGQRRVNDAAHSSLQKYSAAYATPTSFNDWLKDGSPEPNTDLINAPKGTTVYTPAPTPGATPGLKVIPANAPTGSAAAKLAGNVLPGTSTLTVQPADPTLIGTPPLAKPASVPRLTEKQSSAAYFGARALETNSVLKTLQEKGFDPASAGAWAQSTFAKGPLQALKSQDIKAYDLAKEAWLQGLLRMESGAAISQKEQGWYDRTFFPVIGDGPEVQEQKASLRNSLEKTASMIAENDELGEKALIKIEGEAEQFHKNYTSGNLVGTPAYSKAIGENAKPITIGGKPTTYIQQGNRFFVPDPALAQKTNAPAKIAVTPK